jgi:hypothetical protein
VDVAVFNAIEHGMFTNSKTSPELLAKAHARSGDAAVIAGYLGKGDSFDRALASFAEKYAKQNMMDYQALVEAVHAGGINAEEGK